MASVFVMAFSFSILVTWLVYLWLAYRFRHRCMMHFYKLAEECLADAQSSKENLELICYLLEEIAERRKGFDHVRDIVSKLNQAKRDSIVSERSADKTEQEYKVGRAIVLCLLGTITSRPIRGLPVLYNFAKFLTSGVTTRAVNKVVKDDFNHPDNFKMLRC